MKRIQLSIAAGVTLCAVVVFAQSLTPGHKGAYHTNWVKRGHGFRLGESNFIVSIQRAQAISAPEWSIEAPLPLTIPRAAEIARTELRKMVVNNTEWDVTGMTLERVGGSALQKWYYTIRFQPAVDDPERFSDGEFVLIMVDMAGRVGQVGPRD